MQTKILIVEDEDALASVLSSKFKLEGFEVHISVNGGDGLREIEAWQPNLILLDIVMPKVNGYEVLESLQKNNNKTPVIVISNSGQDVELEKIKKLGAVDYIIKTQINPEEFVGKVKNISDNHYTKDSKKIKKNKEKKEEVSGGAKILLVEDDSFLRDICFKKLKKEGFNVVTAVDGEEAVKKVSEFKPAIVLLDIILPAMDGFEVLKEIRSHKDILVKNVPVIMLTNLGQEEDNKKAISLGASDYLVKAHFTTEEIVEKIKNRLGL
ncbi:response regulator [Candidatus Falkowbacteria bacterium]|nr:response regulator [Candidatus Falkowbacteria bacterium]